MLSTEGRGCFVFIINVAMSLICFSSHWRAYISAAFIEKKTYTFQINLNIFVIQSRCPLCSLAHSVVSARRCKIITEDKAKLIQTSLDGQLSKQLSEKKVCL